MTKDCKEEMRNCISKYREELAGNKMAIKEVLVGNGVNNISDHFYNGDKVCDKERFNEGNECQDTKYGTRQTDYTYDEWKQKTEKSHAKDLLKILKETAECRILEKLKDYEGYHKAAIEEIRKELDIDSKLKAIFKERQQPETDETREYYDVIKSFYENEDMRLQLKCRDFDCFNRIIENKLSEKEEELANIKNNFIEDTQNILKYIQVEESIL